MTRDIKFDDHTDATQPCKLHNARDIALAVSLLGGVGPVPKPRACLRLERKRLAAMVMLSMLARRKAQ